MQIVYPTVFPWLNGDLLFCIQEEEGWLRGRLHEKTGVFPSNFVRLSPAENGKPKRKIFVL